MNGPRCACVPNIPTSCSTASMEALEARLLLASATLRDGVLTIRGTPRADAISIQQPSISSGFHTESDPIVVDFNYGVVNHQPSFQFDARKIRVIRVYGGLGNDGLHITSLIAPLLQTVTLDGGSGRDFLTAGFGDKPPFSTILRGGMGDDKLQSTSYATAMYGGAGNDTLLDHIPASCSMAAPVTIMFMLAGARITLPRRRATRRFSVDRETISCPTMGRGC